MVKNTNKSLKLIKPIISKRIIAFLLNILVFGACSLALYFATLYGVFATGFNYIDNQNYINEVKKDNNLNLKEDLTNQEYKKLLIKFNLRLILIKYLIIIMNMMKESLL